jgi:hypothetical protein
VFSRDVTVRTAALLYLAFAIVSIPGMIYVPDKLIVSDDATATINNILDSEGLFRFSIVSQLIAQALFFFLVLALYRLLSKVDKTYASVMVALVMVAVPIGFLNELNQLAILGLLSGDGYLAVFETEELHALVMFFSNLHEDGWLIASVFWGLWLFPLGLLVYKCGFFPKVLGILLMIAGGGYVIESFGQILSSDSGETIAAIASVLELGEVAFILWLVIRGANPPTTEQPQTGIRLAYPTQRV